MRANSGYHFARRTGKTLSPNVRFLRTLPKILLCVCWSLFFVIDEIWVESCETKVSVCYVECFCYSSLPNCSLVTLPAWESFNEPLSTTNDTKPPSISYANLPWTESDTIRLREISAIRNFYDFNFEILKLFLLILCLSLSLRLQDQLTEIVRR